MVGRTEPLQKRVGRLLRVARQTKGWTQRKLAEEATVSYDMVVKIETGRSGARFPTIERLASALEIDPGELFISTPYTGSGNTALHDFTAKLATLSPPELAWVTGIVEAALRPKAG